MEPKNNNRGKQAGTNATNNELITEAHDQADKDFAKDADFCIHNENDDLDEGELARLGEDVNGVILPWAFLEALQILSILRVGSF